MKRHLEKAVRAGKVRPADFPRSDEHRVSTVGGVVFHGPPYRGTVEASRHPEARKGARFIFHFFK